MKKLVSVLLCVTMLVTMMLGTVGFAAVGRDDKGTITINKLETTSNVKVSAYKIMNVDFNKLDDVDRFCGYSFVDSVKTWMNNNGYSAYTDGTAGIDKLGNESATYQEAFYSELATAIQKGDIKNLVVITKQSEKKASLNFEAGLGQYLVLVTGGQDVYKPIVFEVIPVLVNGDYIIQNPEKDTKSSEISISKTIENKKEITSGVGEVVNYEISAPVPKYPEKAINTIFSFTDKISEGIDYNVESMTVKTINGVALTENTDYTLTWTDKGKGFVIDFKYDKIKSYEKVVVNYTATVNDKAVVGPAGNGNDVILKYASNPNIVDKYDTKEDNTKLYTFGLDLTKFAKDEVTGNRIYLEGAIFELSKKNASGEYEVLPIGTAALTTDANGKIRIDQLKEGEYLLKEIQAPGGYNKRTDEFKFTIEATKDTDGKYTGQCKDADGAVYELGYYTIEVQNYKTTLPSTGGMGTMIFTVVGIVLMLGAVVYLIIKKKMSTTR